MNQKNVNTCLVEARLTSITSSFKRIWAFIVGIFSVPKSPITEEQLLQDAEDILQQHRMQVCELLMKPLTPKVEITFSINGTTLIAATSGTNIGLNLQYFQTHDDPGAIVHEIVHAIEQAPDYTGEFWWMIEGIADFIRYKAELGTLDRGDPRHGYKEAADFFNHYYNSDYEKYKALVTSVNAGVLLSNIDQLVQDYLDTG